MRRMSPRRLILTASATAALATGIAFWRCLPDPLFADPSSAVLLARDGALLGAKIATDGQWRFPLHDDVPPRFAAALITYEDKRFYSHLGVDPLALLRAAYLNVKHRRVVSGGSTISMQVIRLARHGQPRTLREKLVEMIWSLRLELGASKHEILALYASHAPFGGNVVGLDAAAWRYFGRHPRELSWAEATMLAVLPNNPALVHPGRHRSELEAKRNELLARLQARGLIDELELRLALLEPLPSAPVDLPAAAPHLLETLATRDTAGRRPYESTIDAALQYSVQQIVARHAYLLSLRGIDNVAALVIDNQRFEVLAYVGNSRWSATAGSGYAIDLVQRPRSTGSVLKPLLYARMLEAGEIVPPTLVPDLPTQYAGYMPKNFDGTYRGAVPARMALARSLNVPAVRMLRRHGVDRFYDFLQRMGMSTLHRLPSEYGLTLILGGAEGTLWDLTAMYANLAYLASGSAGRALASYRRPILLRDETAETGGGPVGLSVGAAWLTMDALVEVVRPGLEREWRSFQNSEKIAWKTGTSYGRRDGWAIGSNARYTVGVWTGNATGEGRPELTGVGAAAPVLFDIFNRLPDAEWFPMPEYALRTVEVCKNDGYLATEGCETELAWTPVDSHFERVSPHQRLIHLDREGRWRVHGRCESVENMRHETWFVLPAGQEYYYRQQQISYRPLPPFRPDCLAYATDGTDERGPMEFLYPNAGTRVYIPIELDGRKGRVVFEVAHRDPDATVFWHLDDRFLGTTTTLHELALDIAEGTHTITVVDQRGNRLSRRFRVLDRRARGTDDHSR